MFVAARKIALLLIVALLVVPAAVRAQQRLQPTGGASLTTFSKTAEATRDEGDAAVDLAPAVVIPAATLLAPPADRAVDAVPPVPVEQTPPDALRAPPAL